MRRRTENDLTLRDALRELPPCEPPASAWDAIEARLAGAPDIAAATPSARWPERRRAMSWAGMGTAAAVALMTAAMVLRAPVPQQRSPNAVTPALVTPEFTSPERASVNTLDALVAESARLERTLVALPRFDGVVRVGTASTIAGLEDHIAWIDAELSAGEAFDADLVFREALWRERVDVMNALIDVQYAQLPATVLLQ